MRDRRISTAWLVMASCALWAGQVHAQRLDQVPGAPLPARPATLQPVPLADVPEPQRENIRKITEQPTLAASGPVEEFIARPSLYYWLLDHPDRASRAWQRLGIPCIEIVDQGGGRFGCTDCYGSDLHWETVAHGPGHRVWYGEGRARPGLLLPTIGVKAVVILHHKEAVDSRGVVRIRHQADMYMQTDSKTAALVARLIGPSAPRLMEACVGQLETFFSGLSRYLNRHPEHAEPLLFGKDNAGVPAPSGLRPS